MGPCGCDELIFNERCIVVTTLRPPDLGYLSAFSSGSHLAACFTLPDEFIDLPPERRVGRKPGAAVFDDIVDCDQSAVVPVIVTLVTPAVRPELGLTLVRLKNLAKVSLSLSPGANKGSRLTPPRLGISIAYLAD